MIINDNKLVYQILIKALMDDNLVFSFEYLGYSDEYLSEGDYKKMKCNLLRYVELMLLDDIKKYDHVNEILDLIGIIFNKLPYFSFTQGDAKLSVFLSENSSKEHNDNGFSILRVLSIEKMISFNNKFYAKEIGDFKDIHRRSIDNKLQLFTFSFYYENNKNRAITGSFEKILNSMTLLNRK